MTQTLAAPAGTTSDPDAVRHIVVLDLETNHLDDRQGVAVEVAWWNLNTDERGHFVPPYDPSWVIATGDPEALAICNYEGRIQHLEKDWDHRGVQRLAHVLNGHVLAGVNVGGFDGLFLRKLWPTGWTVLGPMPKPHHRPLELASYAAGVLRLPLDRLPSLESVVKALGWDEPIPHDAAGDVDLEGRCFLELFRRAGVTLRR